VLLALVVASTSSRNHDWQVASSGTPRLCGHNVKAEMQSWQPRLSQWQALRASRGVDVTRNWSMVSGGISTQRQCQSRRSAARTQYDPTSPKLMPCRHPRLAAKVLGALQSAFPSSPLATRNRTDAADLESSRALVASSQARASPEGQIHAPFSGRFGYQYCGAGQYIKTGDALVNCKRLNPPLTQRWPQAASWEPGGGQTVP